MADIYTGAAALAKASEVTGLDEFGNPIQTADQAAAIPGKFRDFQDQHFTVDGFNSLSPFEQNQINQTLSGFKTYQDSDPNDPGRYRSSGMYAPQEKNAWKSYLEMNSPGRVDFLSGNGYGVEDEMRYLHSLFDDDNLEIPVEEEEEAEEEVTEESTAEEQAEMKEGAGDAKDETEEEAEEEEELQTILMNGSTQVTKENARVSTNRTSAEDGGTQGYKKGRLANVATSKNSNLNIK